VINEGLLLLLLLLLIVLRHRSPSPQYMIIIQPRPHSTHHLLDLIARERPRSSPCTKLSSNIFAGLRVHWSVGCWSCFVLSFAVGVRCPEESGLGGQNCKSMESEANSKGWSSIQRCFAGPSTERNEQEGHTC
jgi:hypothetical protein